MHRDGLAGVLLKFGGGQTVGAQTAIGLVPEGGSEGQPAGAVDDHAQGGIVGRRCIHRARAQMVEIVATVLGDADHLVASAALGNVDQEAVAGFRRQKTQANDLADGYGTSGCSFRACHGLLADLGSDERLIGGLEPVK